MDAKSYPFTPEQEEWLHELETTDEPQTTEYLHRLVNEYSEDSDDPDQEPEIIEKAGYCCLGIACLTIGIPEKIDDRFVAGDFDGYDAHAPAEVVHRLRLRGSVGELAAEVKIPDGRCGSLAAMNDAGWSFKRIAAYIRENPENVFLPLEGDV